MAQQLARYVLCLVGILLSIYAFYVETTKEVNPGYQAMCDIGKSISCSKVFTSNFLDCTGADLRGNLLYEMTYHPVTGKYGRGFGLIEPVFGKYSILNQPNSVFGVLFYCIQIIFGQILIPGAALFVLITAILANCGSVYLAYILAFILEDFCLVCVSTYVVNFLLLIVNIRHRRHIKNRIVKKTK